MPGGAFRLGEIAQKVVREPYISLLKEASPRKGFLEGEQLDALLPHLPESVRPVIEVAYITVWRMRSEILTRKWEHVDFKAAGLRLDPGETKNAEGRSFAFTPELRFVVERQPLIRAKTFTSFSKPARERPRRRAHPRARPERAEWAVSA